MTRFFFEFLDFPQWDRIELTEMAKYDGLSLTVEQGDNWGRDVRLAAEEVSLMFYKGAWDSSESITVLPDGTPVYYLTMGYEHLLQAFKHKGYESTIILTVEIDGEPFTIGECLFISADLSSHFEIKIIDQTKAADIKRNEKVKIDVFSDKDLNGGAIEPLTPVNMLLQAFPYRRKSRWEQSGSKSVYLNVDGSSFNTSSGLTEYAISDSYTPFFQQTQSPDDTVAHDNFRYLLARNNLRDVKIKISQNAEFRYRHNGEGTGSNASLSLVVVVYQYPSSVSGELLFAEQVYYLSLNGTTDQDVAIPPEFDVNIPLIPRDWSLAIFWRGTFSTATEDTHYYFHNSSIEILATEEGIDSIVHAVRYVDLFKQALKSINGMLLVAPKLDTGVFKDRYAFSGNMIRGFTNAPFLVEFKSLMDGTQEVAGGYQITPDVVFWDAYAGFYTNRELASFRTAPDEGFRVVPNEDHRVRTFEYGFEGYEQDREEANTRDAIHTDSQWNMANEKPIANKPVKVNHILDPRAIESARREGVARRPTTSMANDDKLFLIDAVTIPPGTRKQFSAKLIARATDDAQTSLQILNSSVDNADSVVFNWTTLGFGVGALIVITGGVNAGTYTVVELTPTVLTLVGGGSLVQQDANEIITIDYPLQDVLLTNRRLEGFTIAEGIETINNFSNLRYGIRPNMYYWEPLLKTWNMYNPDGVIRNTYYKNDPDVTTQFMNGPIFNTVADIPVDSLQDAKVTQSLFKTKVPADFNIVRQLWDSLNEYDEDGIGGFIRIADPNNDMVNIYPTKMDFVPADGLLTIEGEERYEPDYLDVNSVRVGLVSVNDRNYDTTILADEWYKITEGFVQLFDGNDIPICNLTPIDKVTVNGIEPNTDVELAQLLATLV